MKKKSKVGMWSIEPLEKTRTIDLYEPKKFDDAVEDAIARYSAVKTVTLYGLARQDVAEDERLAARDSIIETACAWDKDTLDGELLADWEEAMNGDAVWEAAEAFANAVADALETVLFKEVEKKEVNVEEWKKKQK